MRGKSILWLSLVAMLLSVSMVNIGISPVGNTKVYITPTKVPSPGAFGHVGDQYIMTVNIDNAKDLWAIGFKIHFAPYVSVLVISELFEGPFLGTGWEYMGHPWTFFTYTVDSFQGTASVSILRLPIPGQDRVGASGDGELMTFKLTVIEAGECPIDITDTILLSSTGSPLDHQTTGSFYYGTTASLIRATVLPGRKVTVGQTMTVETKVRNNGDVPVWVMVRLDISRLEDGRKIVIRDGQTYFGGGLGEPRPYTYLYVDEFDEWYYEWNNPADNLFGTPDGAYIEGDTNAAWASLYSFEDITLAGREIADINVEGWTRYPNGYTEAADIDVYDVTAGFAWWGSLWGTDTWGWHGVRWTSDSVLTTCPYLSDETNLNNVQILLYDYYGDAPDVEQIDSMRLKVEFANILPVPTGSYENLRVLLMPGEELVLPLITWPTETEHIGSYEATATIEYTSELLKWNAWGSTQKTFAFSIVP